MRSGLSSFAALLAIPVAGVPAVAQITVSTKLVEAALPDAEFQKEFEGKQALSAQLKPNSNAAGVYFVYAKNTHPTLDRTLVVELRGEKGEFLGEGKAEKVTAGSWKVIRFAKPAPPPPTPAPAPSSPVTPIEPPPPGVPVARGTAGFKLATKLFDVDDKGNKAEVKVNGRPFEQGLEITFMEPADYIQIGALTYKDKLAYLKLTAKAPGKSTAKITFPDQPGGLPPSSATGVFSRILNQEVDGKNEKQLGGTFPDGLSKMHLAIDGVERVFVYEPGASTADQSDIKPVAGRRLRLVPVGGVSDTKPTAAFAVRVEADNPGSRDKLELSLRKAGTNDAFQEVIPLGGARDEKLWVDVAETTQQGLGFSTKTTDWVKAVDLSAARGSVEIKATLTPADGGKAVEVSSTIFVDADAPTVTGAVEVGDPAKPKERLLKGNPLPVRAMVTDNSGRVRKVTFVLFSKLQDDGTLPPDAVKADGIRMPKIDPKSKKPIQNEFTDEWVAELTPPADKKGRFQIAAVAADVAGNETKVGKADPAVKVIEIVDPGVGAAVARGSISGIVIHAGRPQPGLAVVVGGGDGKAKAVAYTNDAGKFCIPNLLPGSYTVLTLKTDSNKGFQSQADVTVEPEKTSTVTLELIRNKDGR